MSKSSDKEMRLHEGELNVMELLWSNKVLAAKDISKIIKEYIGWEKNTTYTVIKKLIEKGAVARSEPNFTCHACISKEEVQQQETTALIDKLFNGSAELFLSAYLSGKKLSNAEIDRLKQLVESLE